ncbi:MAG: AtpZ/AtpI family protein [Bacteroidales bacterium]|jgi:F0F1-type ATP synthase assembly protein I|nr:AtpZ/AtpI family protein [Bacteroidales bacterium]
MVEQEPKKEKNPEVPENKDLGQFAKYSGIVVQMFVIIFITTWGGMKLDKLAEFSKPVFTIILSLLGVFSAIYVAIKDFIKK